MLEAFPADFQAALVEAVFGRLGIKAKGDATDTELLVAMETALAKKTVQIDRFFFDWRGGRRRAASSADPQYESEDFANLSGLIEGYEPAVTLDHSYWSDAAPCSMHIDEVETIWARIDEADDWSPFETKIEAVRRMGEAMRGRP
jgi:uncharacterized protein YdiU (UPF0061 family)